MTIGDDVLDEILSDAPPKEPTTPEPTIPAAEQQPGQVRDDKGRFAPVAGEPAAPATPVEQPIQQIADPQRGTVPLPALHEARQEAKQAKDEAADLRRQLAELTGKVEILTRTQPQPQPQTQEQVKPKDFWDNPDEFAMEKARAAVAPVETMVRQFIFSNSEQAALREHGNEKVVAAQDALKAAVQRGEINPQEVQARLTASMDPVGDVVRWHQRQSALQTVGSDPNAWLEAEIQKRMADPAFQAKVIEAARGTAAAQPANANGQAPATQLPPTLSAMPGGANASTGGDLSSEALFSQVTAGIGARRR